MAALALAILASPGELLPAGGPSISAAPVEACSGDLYQALDFWVGGWNVYARDSDELVARSRVEKINNGCAVREIWLSVQGQPGGSLNAPDLISGRWHQYWQDRSGAKVDLEGGLFHGSMVLSGPWQRVNGSSQNVLLKVTYTRLDGDSVRQLGEFSSDEGLTWEVSFDYLYLRNLAD